MPAKWTFGNVKTRTARIAEFSDPKNITTQEDARDEYLAEMEKAGITMDQCNQFEKLLADEADLDQWFQDQIRAGLEELDLREEDIKMRREDAIPFLEDIQTYQDDIEEWDVKSEELLGENAKRILGMIKRNPRIASIILDDKEIRGIVHSGLAEEKDFLKAMRQHFEHLDTQLKKDVMEKVDAWQLPQKLQERVSDIRKLLTHANERRAERETTINKLMGELKALQDEAGTTKQNLEASQSEVAALRDQLSALQQSTAADKNASANQNHQLEQQLRAETEKVAALRSELTTQKADATEEVQRVVEQGRKEVQRAKEDHAAQLEKKEQQLTNAANEAKSLSTEYSESKDTHEKSYRELVARFQSACHLIIATTGQPLGLDGTNIMIECQSRSDNQQPGLTSEVLPYTRHTPWMKFEETSAATHPLTNAINFCAAVLSGHKSFAYSQSLFNTVTVGEESAAAFPWVLEALRFATSSTIEKMSWPADLSTLNMVLTVLQGVAYLHDIAWIMGFPSDDVQALFEKVETALSERLGPGSIIAPIFYKVKLSLAGTPITTWVSEATSDVERANRLDSTNSDVGFNRHILADATSENFLVIERIDDREVLSTFSNEQVARLQDHSGSLTLIMPDREFLLALNIARNRHVRTWSSHKMPGFIA
ncbi:MAG: hypothetical protein L6R40_007107 [Gallowayella cf. fulva]|nr:MAG: hypothetical protein L6R40_007107 [Xanthomendoza cf. fulva]